MPITIQGIRLTHLAVETTKEGKDKFNAHYELISSSGKVLAKQSVGGYNGMELNTSPATLAALDAFVQSYTKDLHQLLGLDVT